MNQNKQVDKRKNDMIYDDLIIFDGLYQENNGHKYKFIVVNIELLIVFMKYFPGTKMNTLESVIYQNKNCTLKDFMNKKKVQCKEYIFPIIEDFEDQLQKNYWRKFS